MSLKVSAWEMTAGVKKCSLNIEYSSLFLTAKTWRVEGGCLKGEGISKYQLPDRER